MSCKRWKSLLRSPPRSASTLWPSTASQSLAKEKPITLTGCSFAIFMAGYQKEVRMWDDAYQVANKVIRLALERNFSKRQAWLCKRIFRGGEVIEQSMPLTSGILARLLVGKQIILERVNNTLPVQLPAPVETRQFKDDLTTMVVANSEGWRRDHHLQCRLGFGERAQRGEVDPRLSATAMARQREYTHILENKRPPSTTES